jgi:thiamine biosynthesis lipoprotein ApbE
MSHNSSPPAALEQVSEIRYVMGTLLDITIFVPSPSEGREILNDTFAIAERLNSVLSTWKPESPVIVFNRDTSTGLRPVDPDLFALVARSQELSDKTDHAFTIGVRPLVEMWEAAAKTGVPRQEVSRGHDRDRRYRQGIRSGRDVHLPQLARCATRFHQLRTQ